MPLSCGLAQAREDFEQLPTAERRLFQQVHAAMNSLDDGEPWAPVSRHSGSTTQTMTGTGLARSVVKHRHRAHA